MWVKRFADGTEVREDRKNRVTWLLSPQDNIVELFLICDGHHSPSLKGCVQYWHSRTALCHPQSGLMRETAERIQGLLPNGKWHTIEWSGGISFTTYMADKAIGKPVKP